MAFAERVGIETSHVHLREDSSQEDVVSAISRANRDASVHGIIVQLPLPVHLDRQAIIDSIDVAKDVDGLTSANQRLLSNNDPSAIIPATARGVKELLDVYSISVAGKKVAVIGRSVLVGAPIARVCSHAGADVIVCHSKTPDVATETCKADIVVVAVGRAGMVDASYLKDGAIVIDVGINRMPDGSIKGDVDFESVRSKVSAITPVPGGVGQMTVLALFENLIQRLEEGIGGYGDL